MVFLYTTTFLPSGKYYVLVGGNFGMIFSYLYILVFLSSRKFIDIDNFDFFLKLYFIDDFVDFYSKVAGRSKKEMFLLCRKLRGQIRLRSYLNYWVRRW